MERDSIYLSQANIPSLFRKYFIPTLLGMICVASVTAIDGIFVGHGVGSDGVAAINICCPPMMIFTGIGLMVGAGCSVVASIQLSKGKEKVARLNVAQALIFVTLLILIPVVFIMAFPEKTARILGSSDNLLPLVKTYLIWYIPSCVFQIWVLVGLFIVRLDGAPKLAMMCSVIAGLANVVLDWLFIFPFGWGLMGAAFATSISNAIGGIIALGYLLFFAKNLKPCMPKWSITSLKLSLRNIGYQCRIGSSALLGESTLAVLIFLGNIVFMHYLGDNGVGAFGIACYYTPFIFMVGNAIAQSAQPIVSYNFGLGRHDRVVQARRLAIATAILCGALVSLIFIFFPKVLVSLFIDPDSEAARIAISGFPYFATGFICFVLNIASVGYFQSVERVVPATCFALLRGAIILIPCFILLPKLSGVNGIWLAMPLSEFLTTMCIFGFVAIRRIGNRKKFRIFV